MTAIASPRAFEVSLPISGVPVRTLDMQRMETQTTDDFGKAKFDSNVHEALTKLNSAPNKKGSFSIAGQHSALVQVSHNETRIAAMVKEINTQLKEFGLHVAHYGTTSLDYYMNPPEKGYSRRLTLLLSEIY